MAGSRAEKSTIPETKDPLAGVTYSQPQPKPPIDSLISNTASEEPKPKAEDAKQRPEVKTEPAPEPGHEDENSKGKVTVVLPLDLLERLRNAAWWQRKTLAGLAEEGIRQVVERLERQHGGPFEPREEQLRTGRPAGARSRSSKGR
jgi:hypothetical protein